MKSLAILLLCLLVVQACSGQSQEKLIPEDEVITDREDSMRVAQIFSEFAAAKDLPTGELLVKIGNRFMGTPYVSHTLETGADEQLVANLCELDCTTFDETVLALALTVKSGDTDFASFLNQLEQIRYRNGIRDGYLSRLHYFSDWLYNNTEKGLLAPLDNSFQTKVEKPINFMSTHPDSYPVLKENPELVPQIAQQEELISERTRFFIPKEKLQANEQQLKDGDIVGLTTSIAGLDIAHVGLVVWVDGRVHLLHASSALEKVVISDVPLADYLAAKKTFTGIMVVRPK